MAPASVAVTPAAALMLAKGCADSTNKTYSCGIRNFWRYIHTNGYSIADALPAKEEVLMNWLTAEAERGVQHASLQVYLAAVVNWQVRAGYGNILSGMERVKLVMRGIRRVQGKVPDKRRPVTFG